MIDQIVMPSMGATGEDVVIAEWLVKEGDFVKEGQQIFVAETDKATTEVEAFHGRGGARAVCGGSRFVRARRFDLRRAPGFVERGDSHPFLAAALDKARLKAVLTATEADEHRSGIAPRVSGFKPISRHYAAFNNPAPSIGFA